MLGGPCFAHGCCLSLSLTRPPVAILNWYSYQKGCNNGKCTSTVFIRLKNIGYHNCFPVYEKNISFLLPFFSLKTIVFFLFSFFLQSLFAPLNGIQQLEDISDTRYQFFLPAFCALRAQFLCDSLVDMVILFRHSSFNYKEFKTKNWREQVPAPLQFIPF